jgi:hypothetical protein
MEEIKNEALEKIKAEIGSQVDLNNIEELLKKNEIEFEFLGTKYRVIKATFQQKNEAYKKKLEKFTELLQDSKYMLEEDLKAIYKKRGIDIDAITQQMTTIETKRTDLLYKLGEALKNKASEDDLKTLKNEIIKLQEDQQMLSIKKTNLLQASIESQSLLYTYQYLTFIVTQKLVNEQWVKAWETFDEFLNSPDTLVNTASFNASIIIGQV